MLEKGTQLGEFVIDKPLGSGNTGTVYRASNINNSMSFAIKVLAQDMASDPTAIPLLIGLGVDELSMNPAAIPKAKALIRGMARASAEALAKEALGQANGMRVQELVAEWAEGRWTE